MARTKLETERARKVRKFNEATTPRHIDSITGEDVGLLLEQATYILSGSDLKAISGDTTFKAAVETWLERHHVASNTEAGYRLVMRRFTEYWEGKFTSSPTMLPLRLSHLIASTITQFVNYREITVSKHTARAARITLIAFGRWLHKHTSYKPDLTSVERVKEIPERNRLTKSQLHAILASAAQSTNSGRDLALAKFVLGTGLRLNEIRELTIGDLHWDEDFISVRSATAKGNKKREVRMFADVADTLRLYLHRYRADAKLSDPVWITQTGEMFSVGGLGGVLRSIKKRAGIPERVGWHALRHAYAYNATASGMPLLDLMTELGHSNPAVTARYASHRPPAERVKVASPLSLALPLLNSSSQSGIMPMYANRPPMHAEAKRRISFSTDKAQLRSKS